MMDSSDQAASTGLPVLAMIPALLLGILTLLRFSILAMPFLLLVLIFTGAAMLQAQTMAATPQAGGVYRLPPVPDANHDPLVRPAQAMTEVPRAAAEPSGENWLYAPLPNENAPASPDVKEMPAAIIEESPCSWKPEWDFGFLARGYYRNDQRIQWSGMESTFGAEGVFTPRMKCCMGGWETIVEGEFYLNQPFDQNILADTPERVSYMGNYKVNTFEISKLYVSCRRGDWTVTAGKIETPFGRYYFPLYTNARIDAPFIRTEAIHWRETGAFLGYHPGIWRFDAGFANGTDDLDSNSSKAIVSRAGLEGECYALGASVKWHDGIGSEQQKQYNNHVGADAMLRWGPFRLSGEVIYDQYGFHRPGFDPDDITWYHSIYYRELNRRYKEPIWGVGYYVDLTFTKEKWDIDLDYGEYYPCNIGNPQHDVTNHRGIAKLAYRWMPCLQSYVCVLIEDSGMIAQEDRQRRGYMLLAGMQFIH
jgi:hypothetical protein